LSLSQVSLIEMPQVLLLPTTKLSAWACYNLLL